ncbi:Cna B-type domain-containing protein [Butyrivibrio sp. MC2021]|uniref:Cna B-type domain-containing protein n=1 Tax=Butyrivibrio sp. MC2021 TaxID=1408306 RepID=UPI000479A171|nr:Cna B-type domain-containing protein [Butyrivibrio sp. MC2021]
MRKVDENRAENYIKKHSRFKLWIAFALCLSLLSGTITFYLLNKPATAMTEEGAKQVGLVLETASSEYEQGLIEKMEDKENSQGDKDSDKATDAASAESSQENQDNKTENSSDSSSEAASTESDKASEQSSGTGTSTGSSEASASASSSNESAAASSAGSQDSSDAASSASSDAVASDASSESSSAVEKTSAQDVKNDVKITVLYENVNGEQVAESKELSITESFDLTKEVRTIDGYIFDNGTIDDNTVVLITKKTTSSASEEENQDAATTASSTEEKKYTYYQVTTASGETKDITEDTDLHLKYYKANAETNFTASDDKVIAKAVLSDPSSLPEGIELTIAEINDKTEGYNYEAYMQALNENADKIADTDSSEDKQTYDATNTLLYDIAFKLGGVEYQPKAGTVAISLTLNDNHLSDSIGATESENVSVVHLPVKDDVMDTVDSTSEATDIKSSDIDVEVVEDSDVDISGSTEKVTFETDSFSAYALVYKDGKAISWKGSLTMTAQDIVKSLGDNTLFGAVAGTFESLGDTDVESNIAVGTLKKVNEFGNTSTVYTHTTFDGYFITKNSTQDGTFKFGLFSQEYSDDNRKPYKIGEFKIDVTGGSGTVNLSTLFDEATLQSYARLYVYELDTKGNVVPDGESYTASDGTKYTVTYGTYDFATENNNDIVGSFSSSYVENNATGENLYHKLKQVPGDTVFVKNSENSYTVYTYPNGDAGTKVQGTFPISVSNMLNTASEASRKLALLQDSGDVMVINAIGTKDGFLKDVTKAYLGNYTENDLNNYLTNQGIYIGSKLLVINLDLSDCKEYTLLQFKVQSDKETAKTGEGWSEIANQIIINPVMKSGDGFVPYTGKLILDTVSGNFVAPKATVDVYNGAVPGAVIAKYLIQRREIHKLSARKYLEQQASMIINNEADNSDIITIKADKYVDGLLAKSEDTGKFSFMLVMLDKDSSGKYTWKPISWDIRNVGSSISFDINPRLCGMKYGTAATKNESTYYFVLFENDVVSGNYSKDNTAILVKIKYYEGGEVEPLYYRITAAESEQLQSNPGTGFFNDQHRIGPNRDEEQFQHVAFYNESTGRSQLRIHKMVVNDFGSGFVRDNTGTALLDNVTFRITNNSTKNYIVLKGFTGRAGDTREAIEYSGSTHTPTGNKYVVTYNRSAQWTISCIPSGTYTVDEVADGLTFTYDPYANKSTYLTTTNLSRVTKYDVTVDREGGNYLGTGGNNFRAVFSVDIPNHFDKAPTNVKVGYADIDNCSHTQTVQVCNYYSIPVGPIQIAKNFQGGAWKDDMAFTFTMQGIGFSMKNSEGNPIDYEMNPELAVQPMPVGAQNGISKVTVTGKDAVNNVATVQFPSIPFRFEGTYLYKITEDSDNPVAGVSYDSKTYYVKIIVSKCYTKFEKSYTYDNMANPAKYTQDTTLDEDFYYLGADVTYATDEAFKNVVATCKLRLGSNPDTVTPDNNTFIVTYGSGSVADVSFTNVLTGKLTVTKQWLDGSTGENIADKRSVLTVYIWQRVKGGDWTLFGTTELSAANNWTQTVTDLPLYNEKGKAYEYTVKESDEYLASYRVTYSYNGKAYKGNEQKEVVVDGSKSRDTGYAMKHDSKGTDFGGVTIINEAVYTNTLPSTGGMGTAPFTVIGLIMAAGAAFAGLLFTRRKRLL